MSIRNFPLYFFAFIFVLAMNTSLNAQYAALANFVSSPHHQLFFASQSALKTASPKVSKPAIATKTEAVQKEVQETQAATMDKNEPTTMAPSTTTAKSVQIESVSAPKLIEKEPTATKNGANPNPNAFVRKTKRIAADYKYFAVVLKESNRPLLSTDPIFKQFGNIVYDKTEHGSYVYMICTPFKSQKSVASFMEIVLKPRFEKAYLVGYKNGVMKQIGE